MQLITILAFGVGFLVLLEGLVVYWVAHSIK